jgi:hypothetical protein
MTIIFLNPHTHKLHICTETDPTRIVDPNDPEIMKYIPNDDILYVEDGHILRKEEFVSWLEGGVQESPRRALNQDFDTGFRFGDPPASKGQQPDLNRHYIHPAHNGTIIIADIKTDKYPDGIELNGKYHFIPIDEIGEELLQESNFFKYALAKGKIEIVNEKYVRANAYKHKKRSAADAALDAILIHDQRPGAARRAAETGAVYLGQQGGYAGDGAIPIYVE